MSEQFKKIDREYCVTDESVNVYGYRLLTSGYLVDEFKKNPVGFFMHNRNDGVLVRWEDFRVEGSKVWAKPVVNLAHPRGEQTATEAENGFLNGASVGRIVAVEASDDPELKISDQTGPTITKWFNRELSFVDIPGNFNALAELYDVNGDVLDLSDLSDFTKIIKPNNMKKIFIPAGLLPDLKLNDDSPEDAVQKALENLVDRANKYDQVVQDLADVNQKLTDKTTEVESLKAAAVAKEVKDLIDAGKASKKLTNEMAANLAKDYATNPQGLKDLIDSIPAQQMVTEGLGSEDRKKYENRSWDDLYESDDLKIVQRDFPDLYDKVKKEKYPNLD